MTLIYLAKSSSCEIKKALFFLIFITGWTALAILPIHFDNADDGNKLATTILLIPPIPLTSFYIIAAFVYVVFNQNPDDDSKINIFAVILILIAWIISWSSLYLIYWSWDISSLPKLPAISEPYEAWAYTIGIATGIFASDQPLSADAVGVDLNLFMALQAITSFFINTALFAMIVSMVYGFISERNKLSAKKETFTAGGFPESQKFYRSPQTFDDFQSNFQMSVDRRQ